MTDERESELARLRGELAGLESAYAAQCARAEKAERELAHLRSQVTTLALGTDGRTIRAAAFELVERELRERGVTSVSVNSHVICAVRAGVEQTERAPMPTLLGAVDLLGEP